MELSEVPRRLKSEKKTHIGNAIKLMRKSLGLTREDLAKRMSRNPDFIGRIERGENDPSIDYLESIALAMKTTIPAIFELSEGYTFILDEDAKPLKNNLAKVLKANNLNIIDLSKLTKIRPATLEKYEDGEKIPLRMIKAIAKALNVAPEEISNTLKSNSRKPMSDELNATFLARLRELEQRLMSMDQEQKKTNDLLEKLVSSSEKKK